MKPIKALSSLASWLMRAGIVLAAYQIYFKTMGRFEWSEISFYIATLFIVFGALIVIAGLLQKTTLSVVSALILTIISVYNIVKTIEGGLDLMLIVNIFVLSISIYFLSNSSGK